MGWLGTDNLFSTLDPPMCSPLQRLTNFMSSVDLIETRVELVGADIHDETS